MRVKLVVGDWSQDGHNQTEDVEVEMPTLPPAPMPAQTEGPHDDFRRTWGCTEMAGDPWAYYDIGRTLIKGNPLALFVDFEENTTDVATIREWGEDLDIKSLTDRYADSPATQTVYIEPTDFAKIWVAIVNKGLEHMGHLQRLEVITNDAVKMPNFNIGGYGLFSF